MTITYRDVSHYQGAYVPIGPTCAKATEGSTFIDPQWGGIRRRTLAGGWPFLPYHFLAHGSIDAQVDHAFGVVGHQPLMLDVESEAGRPDPTLADVLAFADRWHTVTGQRVTLAYIPHWYWSGHWGSPSLDGLTSRRIGLVSSLYDHGHADDGPGWDPYGGVTPVIWQYTSEPYDTNAFKGTVAQLAALWANGTVSTHPFVPVVEDQIMDVILPASYGGDGKRTITAEQALSSIMRYVLEARNDALAAAVDPDKLAAAIVAKLPAAGTVDVAAVKAAVAEVLTGGTDSVTAP